VPEVPAFVQAAWTGRELVSALAVVMIWGMNFVTMKHALHDLTPFQLGAARFAFAALPLVLFVKRPNVPIRWLLAFGLTQGVGQFGLLFLALKVGMTAALASVLMQTQVFFMALFGVWLLHERIGKPLRAALVLAGLGIGCFLLNFATGHAEAGGTTLLGLVLTLGAAAMWSASGIITRKVQQSHPDFDAVQFMVWSSLAPILPFIALSLIFDVPSTRWQWLDARFSAWAGAAYLGWIATVLASGLWTDLLKRHPANRVAPFGLGVPVVGLTAGMALLGERITHWQWAGIGFVVAAVAMVIFGGRLFKR
jgi:O-acetylserine/cysteine efflux transporter